MATSKAFRTAAAFLVAWGLFGRDVAQPQLKPAASEKDLVAALVAAETDEERAALLESEPRLLTLTLRKALSAHGEELQGHSEYARALVLHELARRVARQIDDKAGIAGALGGMGKAHHGRGDFSSALRDHQASLALYEELADRPGIAEALGDIGTVLYRRGDYAGALTHLERGLAISEAIGVTKGVARAWLHIGVVRYLQSDYPAAMAAYEKSARLGEQVEDRSTLATSLNNIGIISFWQGNYELALQHYHRGLKLREELGARVAIGQSLNNVAGVHHVRGNYGMALEYYHKALSLQLENAGFMSQPLHNIGLIHEDQGNYDVAVQFYRRALADSEAVGDRAGIALALSGLGDALGSEGKHGEALQLLARALELNETLGNKRKAQANLDSMGVIAQAQGQHTRALDYYQKSLGLSEALGQKRDMSTALTHIAGVENLQGRPADGARSAERAAVLAREVDGRDLLWRARWQQGKSYRALRQAPEARRALEEALENVESLRADAAGGPQESQRFLEGKIAPYHELVALMVAEGMAADALAYAERAKARMLLDVLRSGQVNITKAMTASELELERRLTQALVTLGAGVRQESALAKPDAARLADRRLQLEKARLDYEGFRSSLYAAHPELKVLRGDANPVDVQQAIGLLPDSRSALLEYVVTEETTFLFVLTRDPEPLRVYALEVGRKDLRERISAFRQQVGRRDLNLRRPAAGLYDLLLKPARAQIEGRSTLVIVADDALWDLPFQALRHAGDRYLLQDYAISYAPSITALREMAGRRNESGSPTLFALGNPALGSQTVGRVQSLHRDAALAPLPHAETEVKRLAQLYGRERSRVYVRAEASEERAKAEAGESRILHFATHGILNEASPMYSQLVLSHQGAGEAEDGLLEAWEILNLDLNADLAVLSACETGRGRVGAGEGMIGLSWAFFVAGCPTTVVSQWKVESASTTELMLAFHRNLIKGESRAQALRSAALRLLGDSRYRHPFYWAGFVVIGDAS